MQHQVPVGSACASSSLSFLDSSDEVIVQNPYHQQMLAAIVNSADHENEIEEEGDERRNCTTVDDVMGRIDVESALHSSNSSLQYA